MELVWFLQDFDKIDRCFETVKQAFIMLKRKAASPQGISPFLVMSSVVSAVDVNSTDFASKDIDISEI